MVDLGDGLLVIESGTSLESYREVRLPGREGMPLRFEADSSDPDLTERKLNVRRGPGSADITSVPAAELIMNWSDRGKSTVLTYKSKGTTNVADPNNPSNMIDLWGYSKKVLVEPEDRAFGTGKNIVKTIYVSAWPTTASKSNVVGWNGYEPFSSSGSCDTLLDVGSSFATVALTNCDSYNRWISSRDGVDYGPGAMGVTYDQGFFTTDGEREAGLAMAVKVNTGSTPYWNDRLSVTMNRTDVFGGRQEQVDCTTYDYSGTITCD